MDGDQGILPVEQSGAAAQKQNGAEQRRQDKEYPPKPPLSQEADGKRERLERLECAMDAIRAKYGSGAIAPASFSRSVPLEKHAPPPGGHRE